ncbi:MAG: SCO family protein [Verrucomicrobiota bacterium]
MFRVFYCFAVVALFALTALTARAGTVGGRVVEVDREDRMLQVELTLSKVEAFKPGQTVAFKVGPGDAEIGYEGRLIRGKAAEYGGKWNLERIFPADGEGVKAYEDVNRRLHRETGTMSRRKFARVGDYIPDFAGIDQHGEFMQIRELRGRPFVINFIFTRCAVPEMCPASTTRMEALQEAARDAGLDALQFVTISFDPEYDSPGVLRQYAEGYGIESENFHLLTGTEEWVDDLLRRFGILTMEEDGTINHTMATLLVDGTGRVAFRKEGARWTVEEFLEAAQAL